VQWNTWVSFQSAQWAKLGQFSVSGNIPRPTKSTEDNAAGVIFRACHSGSAARKNRIEPLPCRALPKKLQCLFSVTHAKCGL
ncbi:hypothetical protein LU667_24480, partial [Pseudomonas kurunegalensis]|uniref:hypothetical protein n=1 Tax=Pseudomonas kurunegalensis TaxID=485880 RepID=UPI001E299175